MKIEIAHLPHDIIEVIYPSEVTPKDVADYVEQLKKDITARAGKEWSALVDQSKLRVMPSTVVGEMARLNAYAQQRGMMRSARVVVDPGSGLQAWRMTKNAGLTIPAKTFETRAEALAWLEAPDAD
ncbi:STAS/SEC14 domain-containing protein [Corallococcus sp. bb12-1]|uniref:STAS/SEC14 domain-containing protein n=1 Tax=Corallococcus terminator TaxID=2316733 RepID=A0A3A8IWR3_9BACT|nr:MULTISPECIES: STAS/SEC14 domain-containing protein [Corallococcus]MCY1039819.1 STAS/SEC14 domain-containing protein [Corallococcus sp. bb12-1]RKG84304.1 STAS/SEC14 domain-containing protein [Corallococcus terminator]